MEEDGDDLHAFVWPFIAHIERDRSGGKYVDEVEMFEETGVSGVTGCLFEATVFEKPGVRRRCVWQSFGTFRGLQGLIS